MARSQRAFVFRERVRLTFDCRLVCVYVHQWYRSVYRPVRTTRRGVACLGDVAG